MTSSLDQMVSGRVMSGAPELPPVLRLSDVMWVLPPTCSVKPRTSGESQWMKATDAALPGVTSRGSPPVEGMR